MTGHNLPTDMKTDWADGDPAEGADWLNAVDERINAASLALNDISHTAYPIPFVPPPKTGWNSDDWQAGWTWQADGDDMVLAAPGLGGSSYTVGYQYLAYPTPPFTLTIFLESLFDKLGNATPDASNHGAYGGIIISDGTKYLHFGPVHGVSNTDTSMGVSGVASLNGATMTSAPTGNFSTPDYYIGDRTRWFRYIDDGTNIKLQCSVNAQDWRTCLNEPRNTRMTPSRIGLGARSADPSSVFKLRLRHWDIA